MTSLTAFATPAGIAFDAAGRLFVEESTTSSRGRILMWMPPFFSGQPASRLLAVNLSNPQPPTVNPTQLSIAPGAIFPVGNGIGVTDTLNSRILVFPPVEQWIAGTTFQTATAVAGQPDFNSGSPNQQLPTATSSTLDLPVGAAYFNSELYVADSGNNRVIVFPQSGSNFGPASRVLGQDAFNLNAPNLTEGREFDFQSLSSGSTDSGLAVDLSSNPPHLYVADTYNNRVLGYKDLRSIQTGASADIVIGQPDFKQVLINYPANLVSSPNASGLFGPTGLAVDASGNLYVADTGNGRVLRFPAPFAHYNPGVPESADLVLGQQNFTTTIAQATQRTMAAPYGLAFTNFPGLLVSDAALNRVLFFQGTSAQFTSGMSASIVYGQLDFNSSSSGSGFGQLNSPRHIATDSDDRLYVADGGNARVSIWDHAPTAQIGEPAAQTLTSGLSAPRGMYVGPVTGDIWVGDAGTGQAIRYPPFLQLVANGFAPNAVIPDPFFPVAVVEDAWGDLFVSDGANRVAIFYPGLSPLNAAEYLFPNRLTPGMITSIFSTGNFNQFGVPATQAQKYPLQTTLGGLQVLFNGSPTPMLYVDPNQINFIVPIGAPQSGTADLQGNGHFVSGRVLGDTTVTMVPEVPGLFSQTGNGVGTVAALNQDNTPNGPTNPATQGDTIQMFGTGVRLYTRRAARWVPRSRTAVTAGSARANRVLQRPARGWLGDLLFRPCARLRGAVADQCRHPQDHDHAADRAHVCTCPAGQFHQRGPHAGTRCSDLRQAAAIALLPHIKKAGVSRREWCAG